MILCLLEEKSLNKKKISKSLIFALILLICGNIVFFFTLWLLSKYDNPTLDQVLFQMKSSGAGANKNIVNSAIIRVGLFSVLSIGLEIFLYLLFSGRLGRMFKKRAWYPKYCATKCCTIIKKLALPCSAIVLIFSLVLFSIKLDISSVISSNFVKSDFIDKHYVDASKTKLAFPEQKRNLIYIFLESMENTYADTEAGGNITNNFIPELTQLAKDNINFSNDEDLGGALNFAGTTWTAAAMVAQTSGIPVKVPLTADTYGGESGFLPGVYSIGQILEKEGYNQTLLLGSDAAFAGRESYFTDHGNYNIVDINSLKEEGRLPEDYVVWWGYEDQRLFNFAKEELNKLAASGEPFNFTMLTADSHFPDGYLCPLCGSDYDEQYANVLACCSKQIYQFVEWIKTQPYYENTTIILSGDHLTMDPKFLDDIDAEYTRTVYNCIINSPITPLKTENRQFATYDMFPTTLAALGVNIEGNRLGLGTNLFSDKKTLIEEHGYKTLSKELNKKSDFYNEELLQMS